MNRKKTSKTLARKKDGTIKSRIPVPPTRVIDDKRKKKEKHKKNLLLEE